MKVTSYPKIIISCLLIFISYSLFGQSGNINQILSDIESLRASGNKNSLNQKLVEASFFYWDSQDKAKAIELLEESAQISSEIGNKHGIANAYHNIGVIKAEQKQYNSSIDFQVKAIKIKQEQGDKRSLANYQLNLGGTYMDAGQVDNAISTLEQSLELGKELNLNNIKTDSYLTLSKAYELKGDKEKALEYFKLYNEKYDEEGQLFVADLKDDYQEKQAQLQAEQAQLQAEKKQKEAELTAKQKELQVAELLKKEAETEARANEKEAELQRMKVKESREILGFTIGVVVLILIFVGFMIRANSRMKFANQKLELQKKEISNQRDAIEGKNTELNKAYTSIQASINYAERIQQASLPDQSVIGAAFDDFFIFFKPRDVVSGDFYWFAQVRDIETGHVKKVLAAIDCTGHGVPGAFMSLVGNSAINQIVNERKITDPSIILSVLNERVIQMLKQEKGKNQDGMDMALIVVDETSKTIDFSGAKNPFYFVKDGELQTIKGSRKPIGGKAYQGSTYDKHTFEIDSPMSCYIFSDGYQDQFGGEDQSRFMSKRLKALITENYDKSMKEQREIFENAFIEWKGQEKQVDDVLLIGFKVSPNNA